MYSKRSAAKIKLGLQLEFTPEQSFTGAQHVPWHKSQQGGRGRAGHRWLQWRRWAPSPPELYHCHTHRYYFPLCCCMDHAHGRGKAASQLTSAGRTPFLGNSPQWQGREIPSAREHQSPCISEQKQGWIACSSEVTDSQKVQGILEFSPTVLEFKA